MKENSFAFIFAVAIVGALVAVRVIFMTVGIYMLSNPYTDSPDEGGGQKSIAPSEDGNKSLSAVETDWIRQQMELPPITDVDSPKVAETAYNSPVQVRTDEPKRLGHMHSFDSISQSADVAEQSDNVTYLPGASKKKLPDHLTAKQKHRLRRERKQTEKQSYRYDLSGGDDFELFLSNNFEHAEHKPKGALNKDFYINLSDIHKLYTEKFPETDLNQSAIRRKLQGMLLDGRKIGKVKSNNVNWFMIKLRHRGLQIASG